MTQPTDPEISFPQLPTLPTATMQVSGETCLVQIYPVGLASSARHVLKGGAVLLGRDEDCDIPIDDRTVSRHHARVEPDGDGYRVVDLGSTNGTFVNETRMETHHLQDGDNLFLGNTIFRFLAGGSLEAAYHEEIHRLAILDPLTGIHNQRHLLEILARELTRSARYQRPLALLLLDIDSFKTINDTLGHVAGDSTLRELAACICPVLRLEALFARYGGEEFAVVLPETNLEDGIQVAERLRRKVEKHPFRYEDQTYTITISVGVTATMGVPPVSLQELLRHADGGLYQAKRQGKNRVVAEMTGTSETQPAGDPPVCDKPTHESRAGRD